MYYPCELLCQPPKQFLNCLTEVQLTFSKWGWPKLSASDLLCTLADWKVEGEGERGTSKLRLWCYQLHSYQLHRFSLATPSVEATGRPSYLTSWIKGCLEQCIMGLLWHYYSLFKWSHGNSITLEIVSDFQKLYYHFFLYYHFWDRQREWKRHQSIKASFNGGWRVSNLGCGKAKHYPNKLVHVHNFLEWMNAKAQRDCWLAFLSFTEQGQHMPRLPEARGCLFRQR